MKILDIMTAPWAILPAKLGEIREIYLRHTRGEKLTLSEIEAQIGPPADQPAVGYDVVNGVAVLPIQGVIGKRMNLMHAISGGVSTELIGRDFRMALSDPAIRSILLSIDSPGGSVDGTAELAGLIYGARGIKPIVAYTDGDIASAAYWIASAADQIFISGDTTQVGSIGVVATHVDVSKAEAQMGIKTTEIVAGKYKRIASEYAPLTDAGRATIQDMVDYIYTAFVGDVARQRGVSVDQVLSKMADGRIFIGRQAVEAGLVDGVKTFDELMNQMASQTLPAGMNRLAHIKIKEVSMEPEKTVVEPQVLTAEQIATKYPEAVKSFRMDGARTELERIQQVEAQLLPGHEALIATLKFDGKTTGGEAAIQVLQAESRLKKGRMDDLIADAPKSVSPGIPGEDNKPSSSLPVEDRCKMEWSKSEAIRNEFVDLASYTAFEKAKEKKSFRVLTGNRES